jgi:Tfp pilus assembly protein PilO
MKSANRVIVAMLVAVVLAVGFWVLALGPKRQQAGDLGTQVEKLKASLAQHEQEAANAAAARKGFPADYQQLVVLGKAVPGDDDTASLLVQVNQVANRAGVRFRDIELGSAAGAAAPAPAPVTTPAPAPSTGSAVPASTPVSPTEAAASTLPLGATIGAAGLGVMPYTLTFDGSFFQVADFIKGIDSLVKTANSRVAVDGRLVTIDGFSLTSDPSKGFPALQATFAVTTYLTPPTQGVTAGATPTSPAPATATPAATTTGGTP